MSEDIRARANQLADLMDEFRLSEARLEGEDWKIVFRRHARPSSQAPTSTPSDQFVEEEPHPHAPPPPEPPAVPKGTPVNSPMTGIYYTAPSPNAPPFVREGDVVEQGQVIGLIEAMKVFNEIVAPVAGTVLAIAAKNGEIVNPGDTLLYIG